MESLNIADEIEYSDARQTRKRLIMSEMIEAELVCYEPGQQTVEHHHVGQDEIYYFPEGEGSVTVDDETIPVKAGSVVYVPADAKHSVQAGDTRLVLVFFKAPGRKRKRAAKS